MIFDGHSDTWADVTIRRLNGEKMYLEESILIILKEQI